MKNKKVGKVTIHYKDGSSYKLRRVVSMYSRFGNLCLTLRGYLNLKRMVGSLRQLTLPLKNQISRRLSGRISLLQRMEFGRSRATRKQPLLWRWVSRKGTFLL
ncbi:hypothetical protein NVP1170O_003 [Vibrio phage 1.170.O._10N.261.52.C3]|nr:hypothetical protein NVP1170O_003 [Vibrio phage 1.170.O._10N.261.52.C3]